MRIFLFSCLSIVLASPCAGQVSKASIKESKDCKCIEVEFETEYLGEHCNSYSLWRYDSLLDEKSPVADKTGSGISQIPQKYSASDCSPIMDANITYILYSLSKDVKGCVEIIDTLSIDTLKFISKCPPRRCVLLKYYITPDTPEHNQFHPMAAAPHTLKIYDRWGKEVFQTSDNTKGWDGGNSPAGTYYWVISFPDESKKSRTGTVTLLS